MSNDWLSQKCTAMQTCSGVQGAEMLQEGGLEKTLAKHWVMRFENATANKQHTQTGGLTIFSPCTCLLLAVSGHGWL
jgi:hypothetical protein